MSRSLKAVLWVLGSAAVLNVIADLWFRLSISGATRAPWYVWAPVYGTIAIAALTLGGQALFRRWSARTEATDAVDSADSTGPIFVGVEVASGLSDLTPEQIDRASHGLHAARPDMAWDFVADQRVLLPAGPTWKHTLTFRSKPQRS